VILSKDNRKDIEDIKPDYIKGITFTYIEEMVEIRKTRLAGRKGDKSCKF